MTRKTALGIFVSVVAIALVGVGLLAILGFPAANTQTSRKARANVVIIDRTTSEFMV